MKKITRLPVRILSVAIAAVLSVSSLSLPALSVPNNNSSEINNISLNPASDATVLEQEVQSALYALDKAYKTGSQADLVAAYKLVAKLSPTQIVRLFALKYADFYRKNYSNLNFPYFNADAYLKLHPELFDETKSPEENRKAALEYYLSYGIYNAEPSGTDFDPIIAIIVQPDAAKKVFSQGVAPSLDELASFRNEYTEAEGVADTKAYELSTTFRSELAGTHDYTANDGILFIGKKGSKPAVDENQNAEDADNGIIDEAIVVPTAEATQTATPTVAPTATATPTIAPTATPTPTVAPTATPTVAPTAKPTVSPENVRRTVIRGARTDLAGISKQTDFVNAVHYDNTAYAAINEKLNLSKTNKAKYTVMVYLCGTDLEDDKAIATGDIVNMLRSTYDLNEVNVLICAGGTKNWNSQVMSEINNDKCAIYYLDPDGITDRNVFNTFTSYDEIVNTTTLKKLMQVDTPVSMGNPELLVEFLDYGANFFPADHYWLSIWNHGGGANSGICFSDEVKDESGKVLVSHEDALSMLRMEEALASSKICNSEGGFDIISLDACEMAGIEVAYDLNAYTKYLIASEEMTEGDVKYNTYLDSIMSEITAKKDTYEANNRALDNCKIAVESAKSYTDARLEGSFDDYALTQAVFDVDKLANYEENMTYLGDILNKLLANDTTSMDTYKMMRQTAARVNHFGASKNSIGTDYVDMYDYFSSLRYMFAQAATTNSTYGIAASAIDQVLDTKFIVYSAATYMNENVYSTYKDGSNDRLYSVSDLAAMQRNNGSMNTNSALYNEERTSYLTGLSIYVPFFSSGILYKNRYDGYDNADFERYRSEAILQDYTTAIDRYRDIANGVYSDNNKTSRGDIITNKIYEDTTKYYKDTVKSLNVKKTSYPGKNYDSYMLTINFNENYSDSEYKTAEFFDPYTDFMETTESVNLYLTANQKVKGPADKEGSTDYNMDLVIGKLNVATISAISGDTLVYDMAINSIFGFSIYGSKLEKGAVSEKEYKDYAHTKTIEDTDSFNSALGIEDENTRNNIVVIDGRYFFNNEGEDQYEDAYIVFTLTNPENYCYNYHSTLKLDNVASENGGYKYSKVDNLYGISVYHSVIYDDASGSRIYSEALERDLDGFYIEDTPVYSVGTGNNIELYKEYYSSVTDGAYSVGIVTTANTIDETNKDAALTETILEDRAYIIEGGETDYYKADSKVSQEVASPDMTGMDTPGSDSEVNKAYEAIVEENLIVNEEELNNIIDITEIINSEVETETIEEIDESLSPQIITDDNVIDFAIVDALKEDAYVEEKESEEEASSDAA